MKNDSFTTFIAFIFNSISELLVTFNHCISLCDTNTIIDQYTGSPNKFLLSKSLRVTDEGIP